MEATAIVCLRATGKCMPSQVASALQTGTFYSHVSRHGGTSNPVEIERLLAWMRKTKARAADGSAVSSLCDTWAAEFPLPWPEFVDPPTQLSQPLCDKHADIVRDFGRQFESCVRFSTDIDLAKICMALYDTPLERDELPLFDQAKDTPTTFDEVLQRYGHTNRIPFSAIVRFNGRTHVLSNLRKHVATQQERNPHCRRFMGRDCCTLEGVVAILKGYKRNTEEEMSMLRSLAAFEPPWYKVPVTDELLETAALVRQIVHVVRNANRVQGVGGVTRRRWDFLLPVHQYHDAACSFVP